MRFRFLPLLFPLLLTACVAADQSGGATTTAAPGTAGSPDYYRQPLRQEDFVYDPNIRSVQCYVPTGAVNERLNPPIVPLEQNQPVRLEFDWLNHEPARLIVKLQQCNADWTPGELVDQQFAFDYNEFYIAEYYSSVNTRVPYYHYRFNAPRVKLSGNYVIHVSDPDGKPLLSRRMVIYENAVVLGLQNGIPPGGNSKQFQQIDFTVSYGQFQLVNPMWEVKVALRQNYRWDNMKYPLKPTFSREFERRLDYQFFNFENAFPALNEFRFFDMRSLRSVGMNVAGLDPAPTPKQVLLIPEKQRGSVSYEQYNDANGFFLTDNRDFGNGDTDADYAEVTFQLRAEEEAPGKVFVVGQLTNWQLLPDFQLTYDAARKLYTGKALLKQGYYNYYFALRPDDATKPVDYTYFEGSRYETENAYDLLVYYRQPGTRYDRVIGYQEMAVNGRLPLRR